MLSRYWLLLLGNINSDTTLLSIHHLESCQQHPKFDPNLGVAPFRTCSGTWHHYQQYITLQDSWRHMVFVHWERIMAQIQCQLNIICMSFLKPSSVASPCDSHAQAKCEDEFWLGWSWHFYESNTETASTTVHFFNAEKWWAYICV